MRSFKDFIINESMYIDKKIKFNTPSDEYIKHNKSHPEYEIIKSGSGFWIEGRKGEKFYVEGVGSWKNMDETAEWLFFGDEDELPPMFVEKYVKWIDKHEKNGKVTHIYKK